MFALSAGLHDVVTDEELRFELSHAADPATAVSSLLALATQR
jgi:hypothetical protein